MWAIARAMVGLQLFFILSAGVRAAISVERVSSIDTTGGADAGGAIPVEYPPTVLSGAFNDMVGVDINPTFDST